MIELAAPPARVAIDPSAGGRLASLTVAGNELLVTRDEGWDPFGWGSFVMAPWCGRIRRGRFGWGGTEHEFPATLGPHAIHGTAYDQAWTVDEADGQGAALSFAFVEPWPFGGRVVQSVRLHPDRLEQTIEVHAGAVPMPATVGWHPWWRRRLPRPDGATSDVELQADLSRAEVYVRDDDYIPDGRLAPAPPGPWDDCFRGSGAVRLRWPGVLELSVEHDCSHLVLFDQLDHAVCVEPQTGPPDAFTLAPSDCTVRPGQPLVARATWRWQMSRA